MRTMPIPFSTSSAPMVCCTKIGQVSVKSIVFRIAISSTKTKSMSLATSSAPRFWGTKRYNNWMSKFRAKSYSLGSWDHYLNFIETFRITYAETHWYGYIYSKSTFYKILTSPFIFLFTIMIHWYLFDKCIYNKEWK